MYRGGGRPFYGMSVLLIGFFFNDAATTEIYTLSLHDALPIWPRMPSAVASSIAAPAVGGGARAPAAERRQSGSRRSRRSEEHTSELQSQFHLVCRLLLEKKKYIPLLLAALVFTK